MKTCKVKPSVCTIEINKDSVPRISYIIDELPIINMEDSNQ